MEKTSALAQAKVETTFTGRERDKALKELGEAVWAQVKSGKLQLPPALSSPVKALQDVEKRAEAKNKEINSLLQEGGEAVDRIKARSVKSTKTAVAARGKKR